MRILFFSEMLAKSHGSRLPKHYDPTQANKYPSLGCDNSLNRTWTGFTSKEFHTEEEKLPKKKLKKGD